MLPYSPIIKGPSSSKMSNKSRIALVNFFVFNSNFGPREGEEEKKVLFYYPPTVELEKQVRDVGLCEAIVRFSITFTDKDTDSLHTQKIRQLFYQPETDYWLIMTVSIPWSEKVRDEHTVIDYHEDDVQDSVYHAVLKQAYSMFKLFNGTFTSIVDKGTVNLLKQRIDQFFLNYLETLKLQQSDLLDVFNGIHFLPLDKNTYLRIQSFVNLLESTFPCIEHTAFLYNDQLVWSGLKQDDMRIMYRYLTNTLLPAQLEQDFQESLTVAGGGSQNRHYGRFILGPPNINDDSNIGKIPQVYVQTESGCDMCHLVVYRALSATLCVLITGTEQITFKWLQKLDKFLGPHTSKLASDIGDQYSKRTPVAGETQFKYVYFNHMNLAQKTTMHSDSTKSTSLPTDVLRILADLNQDLKTSTCVDEGETVLKAQSECWVVGKKSDQREFYVVLNQKNANLFDINEEVKRLCATHFNNIFFLD